MSLKNIKIIGCFFIFSLCFLFHFAYTAFPNFLFSIFFPVNESIFEHLKLITSSILFWGLFENILLQKKGIIFNNYILSLFAECLIGVASFLLIYYPLYNFLGSPFWLNVSCLFVSICIASIFGYYILNLSHIDNENFIGALGIVLVYIVFGILTYFPFKTPFFYDTSNDKYGINIYND